MPKIIQKNFNINHKYVNKTIELAEDIKDELNNKQIRQIENFKKLDIWEQDLLMLNSQGYSLREIASKLSVSSFWVFDKLREIRKKIDNV